MVQRASTRQGVLLLEAFAKSEDDFIGESEIQSGMREANTALYPDSQYPEEPFVLSQILRASCRDGEVEANGRGQYKIARAGLTSLQILRPPSKERVCP